VTTRGVLHPEAIGTMFSLERCRPPADLARFVDVHWLVSWDLRGREPYRSQVLPHPCAHLVFEPGGATVHGISRGRFERRLDGAGWAVGTKFLPAGIEPFSRLPVRELTDRVLGLSAVFGDLFSAYVGIGPKWVLQRYRLHEAVEQAQGQGTVDWARLALELGYYDQAHFVRDLRSLVGRTPAQYDAERAPPGPDRTRSAAGA
jgi:AraC-like DNA-binding protein